MLEYFKNRLVFNMQLVKRVKELETQIERVIGENQVLREWNDDLHKKADKYEQVIFSKFGLVDVQTETVSNHEPIRTSSNWRTSKNALEEHWRNKEKKDIESGKLSKETNEV